MNKKTAKPKTLDGAFAQVEAELLETFIQKHKDYGKGNILSMKELGIAFRIGEKAERLRNLLMKDEQPANESLEDSWTDIAVYAIIAKLHHRGLFQELEVDEELMKKD